MQVSDILSAIEAFAPPHFAQPDDNVGLLVGRKAAPVYRVLVSLDITDRVIAEAAASGAELIVSHHPVTFGTRAVTDNTAEGARLLSLIEHGIAAICMHTNWDAAPGGINDLLARAVGLNGTLLPLGRAATDPQGRTHGLGRVGFLPEPMPPKLFAEMVRRNLSCRGVRLCAASRPCHLVAVGSGSSGSQFDDVLRHGCDTFVTGDVKHSLMLDAADRNITLIDAGHFPTEDIAVQSMVTLLRDAFPGLAVEKSRMHNENLSFLVE